VRRSGSLSDLFLRCAKVAATTDGLALCPPTVPPEWAGGRCGAEVADPLSAVAVGVRESATPDFTCLRGRAHAVSPSPLTRSGVSKSSTFPTSLTGTMTRLPWSNSVVTTITLLRS